MPPLQRLLRLLALILFVGAFGVGAELVLIEHDESWQELLPIGVLGGSSGLAVWHLLRPSSGSRNAIRVAAAALVVVGLYGLYLHFVSNYEFQQELHPELGGWRLVLATMRAHSPPSLGPGVMALLGAIAWLCTAPPSETTT